MKEDWTISFAYDQPFCEAQFLHSCLRHAYMMYVYLASLMYIPIMFRLWQVLLQSAIFAIAKLQGRDFRG